MTDNYLMFEKLPPAKLLLKCAVPAALSMIFSGLYSIADGIFVGRCIGCGKPCNAIDRYCFFACGIDCNRIF